MTADEAVTWLQQRAESGRVDLQVHGEPVPGETENGRVVAFGTQALSCILARLLGARARVARRDHVG